MQQAILNNDVDTLEYLIWGEENINSPHEDCANTTPLIYAIQHNKTVSVKCLLKNKASPDVVDGNGLSLLRAAALYGNQDITNLLIEAIDEHPPFLRITCFERKNVAKLLITHNADINKICYGDCGGKSHLSLAYEKGWSDEEIENIFLENHQWDTKATDILLNYNKYILLFNRLKKRKN